MKMNRIRKRPPASRDKRPLRFFAFVFIAAAVLPTAVAAQVLPEIPPPSDTVYEVGLADGSSIVGRITEVDPQQVVITTLGGGRLEIGRTQVRTVRVAAGRFVRGEYWHEDPGGTRLFFTATGRTLARGESYIGTYVIFLPFAPSGSPTDSRSLPEHQFSPANSSPSTSAPSYRSTAPLRHRRRSERSPSSLMTRWSGSPTEWARSATRTTRFRREWATSIPAMRS